MRRKQFAAKNGKEKEIWPKMLGKRKKGGQSRSTFRTSGFQINNYEDSLRRA